MINYALSAGPHYTHWHTTSRTRTRTRTRTMHFPGLEPLCSVCQGSADFSSQYSGTYPKTYTGRRLSAFTRLLLHILHFFIRYACLVYSNPVCVCYCGVAWWIVCFLRGSVKPPLFFYLFQWRFWCCALDLSSCGDTDVVRAST